MKARNRIFIYGTLKQGHYFHNQFLGEDKSVFYGPATTTNEFVLYIDGLPHMVREKSETGVKGELYEIDDDVLRSIDELEGHPTVYHRELVEVFSKSGERVLAWAYLRNSNFKGKINSFKESEFV